MRPPPKKSIAPKGSSEAFLRSLIGTDEQQCILWPYRLAGHGYGLAVVGGVQRTASRWMCVLAHGEPGLLRRHAAHSCDNPACVNPNHLKWATHRENMFDKERNGSVSRGERNGKTRLTEEDVAYIRAAPPDLQALASRFGMTRGGIAKVRGGKRWKHIPGRAQRPECGGLNVLCRNGHPYDEANTHWTPQGYRRCRACDAASHRRSRHGVQFSDESSTNQQGNAASA